MNCNETIKYVNGTLNGTISKIKGIEATLSKANKVIEYKLPPNYGLITWNGRYMLIS